MTAAQVQTLIDSVPCDLCNAHPELQWYLVLAAMIDIANGDPVPTTTQGLITEAECLFCLVPPGLLPYLMVQALRDISSGGGGGAAAGAMPCTVGIPVAAPSTPCALAVDSVDGTIYEYYAGAWH